MDEDIRELERLANQGDGDAARKLETALRRSGREADVVERYRFKFECPQSWEAMTPTAKSGVRFCKDCSREVHYAWELSALAEHVKANRCVAVAPELLERAFEGLSHDPSLTSATSESAPCVVKKPSIPRPGGIRRVEQPRPAR